MTSDRYQFNPSPGDHALDTVAVIGSVARDDAVWLAELLQSGAHLNGTLAGSWLGGGGANTAVALVAAGHTAILLAAVGRDATGEASIG